MESYKNELQESKSKTVANLLNTLNYSDTKVLSNVLEVGTISTASEMEAFMNRCTPEHLKSIDAKLFIITKKLYDDVINTENTSVHIEQSELNTNSTYITVASTNEIPERMLLSVAQYLRIKKYDIEQMNVNCIEAPDVLQHSTGYVIISRIGIIVKYINITINIYY